MSIGSRIKEARLAKKITQPQLASLVGVSKGAIGNYESGVSSPKDDILFKIIHALDVDANFIFQDEMQDLKTNHYSTVEANIIKKYRALDEHGTRAVDSILKIEYERCTVKANDNEETAENQFRQIQLSLLPASAGFGSFLDSNDSEGISIPATEEYRQVDFAVRVSGDSMEPDYHDGDIVLVREQPSVEVGEVGLFTVDNMGYIKEQGEDMLISRNPDYSDIFPNEYENVKCWGKVVGVLK